MEEFDFFWATALSVGSIILGVLGSSLVAVYHSRDMKKRHAEGTRRVYMLQDQSKQEQFRLEIGRRVVNSVNSNNNSPRLGENLSDLSFRLEQLGMKLNVDVNGCVENARR